MPDELPPDDSFVDDDEAGDYDSELSEDDLDLDDDEDEDEDEEE